MFPCVYDDPDGTADPVVKVQNGLRRYYSRSWDGLFQGPPIAHSSLDESQSGPGLQPIGSPPFFYRLDWTADQNSLDPNVYSFWQYSRNDCGPGTGGSFQTPGLIKGVSSATYDFPGGHIYASRGAEFDVPGMISDMKSVMLAQSFDTLWPEQPAGYGLDRNITYDQYTQGVTPPYGRIYTGAQQINDAVHPPGWRNSFIGQAGAASEVSYGAGVGFLTRMQCMTNVPVNYCIVEWSSNPAPQAPFTSQIVARIVVNQGRLPAFTILEVPVPLAADGFSIGTYSGVPVIKSIRAEIYFGLTAEQVFAAWRSPATQVIEIGGW